MKPFELIEVIENITIKNKLDIIELNKTLFEIIFLSLNGCSINLKEIIDRTKTSINKIIYNYGFEKVQI